MSAPHVEVLPITVPELDLVIVMQRADAHARRRGHAPHGPVIVHGTDYAA
ncbi:hypothetical protein [Streptomyces sp. BE230]|nr:hypothetical protein [Streptomyces sp. BE230]